MLRDSVLPLSRPGRSCRALVRFLREVRLEVNMTALLDRPHSTVAKGLSIALLIASVSVAPACSSDSHQTHTADPATDAAPDLTAADAHLDASGVTRGDCIPSGISEAQATRKSAAASVTVDVVLLNAVDGCRNVLRFKLVLDTHSFPLLALDLPASARLESSSGIVVTSGFSWVGSSESDHHREGILGAASANLAGSAWLRLTVKGIAGVDRTFEWDSTSLGWASQP
jgi:hypothetical protein